MRVKRAVGFLTFVVIYGLSGQISLAQITIEGKVTIDPIVGRKIITNQIAGESYRKRAIGYFVILGKDTSDYTCIFTESNDGGKIGMVLNIPYRKASMTYSQRLDEIRMILPKAAKDFDFASLTSIYFGRLILSGDLAVDITKQYRQKFGLGDKFPDNATFGEFLVKSKLGTDLDSLLNPYSISVDKVSVEHLFFTTKKDLYWASKIETDISKVPDKILDCMTWVQLTKQ